MRNLAIFLMVSILISGGAFAQYAAPGGEDITYGKLTVYSDVVGADIYVDAKFVGQDRATISNIPTGKHYVRVAKMEETIQSGIVTVNEGEETIIVAKQDTESLLERSRKPNQVMFYFGYSDLGYSEAIPSTTIIYEYKPQLGFGAEVEFPVPIFDFRIDVGFFQNYPAGIITSPTQEAYMAVSTPYLNVSKNFFKTSSIKVDGGVGMNYGIFTPGQKTAITIESRLGYQAFLEMLLSSGQDQAYRIRAGYVSFAGESAYPGNVTTAGYYVQGGIAYQL